MVLHSILNCFTCFVYLESIEKISYSIMVGVSVTTFAVSAMFSA